MTRQQPDNKVMTSLSIPDYLILFGTLDSTKMSSGSSGTRTKNLSMNMSDKSARPGPVDSDLVILSLVRWLRDSRQRCVAKWSMYTVAMCVCTVVRRTGRTEAWTGWVWGEVG